MPRITKFALKKGDVLAGRYIVLSCIGKGWEGEVYLVREKGTGVPRAAKLFYPHRDKRGKTTRFTARKLHKLRDCKIMIQYHHNEEVDYDGTDVRMLVSEYVDGQLLSEFLKEQPGKRLRPYEGLHLLRSLVAGVARIHELREYHGDIHSGNIIINRRGAWFDIKLIDVYNYGKAKVEHASDDVIDTIHIFYEAIGGKKQYAKQPQWVKDICCGLKRNLIKRKFRTAQQLVRHLDTFEWD